MKRKLLIILLILTLGVVNTLYAADDRSERSYMVFAKGIDTLLLDTEHVFVRIEDKAEYFYLDGMGVFFIGRISMTASSNFSVVIDQWSKWFDQKSETEKESQEGDDAAKQSEKEKLDKKYQNIIEKDRERITEMDRHLTAFKQELITTIFDYGPILKGVNADESIVVVFFVKNEEFEKKYGKSQLVVSVRFDDLQKAASMSPLDPKVQKLFKFNI
ncbi:hypothetical protein JW979_09185 [bacterium]|nr:hypothetical protein [candidate division CSSED10-310 bacterium]